MEQLDLAGLPATDATPRYSLFFALWPDAATRARIDEATTRLLPGVRGGGRRLRPDRYHLTLRWLGEHPAEHAPVHDMAMRAAAGVRLAGFEMPLDIADGFPSSRVCWLGSRQAPASLHALRTRLDAGLAGGPVRLKGATALVPHVTVVRDCGQPWPRVPLDPPIPWRVERFVLVRSDLANRHAYEEVGSWPLGH